MRRYSSLRGVLMTRFCFGTLTTVALLCLALCACGGSPATTGAARATSTPNALNAASGGGCNGCVPNVPTITVTPAQLTVSPTTITSAMEKPVPPAPGPPSSGPLLVTFDVTLTNDSSTTPLRFTITGVKEYGFTANPIAPRGSSVVHIAADASRTTTSFEVIGPANTVTVTVDAVTP